MATVRGWEVTLTADGVRLRKAHDGNVTAYELFTPSEWSLLTATLPPQEVTVHATGYGVLAPGATITVDDTEAPE